MAKKHKPAASAGTKHDVWIELDKPKDDADAREIVAKANRMLNRLREPDDLFGRGFGWDASRKQYTYGDGMGYKGLADRGEWFSLDYFGRA